jgi:hypothetical protein
MKIRLRYVAGVVTLLIGLLAAGVVPTRGHWWSRVSTASISYKGKKLPDSKLYVSKDGEYMLILKGVDFMMGPLIIYPKNKRFGLVNGDRYYVLPGCVYASDYPVTVGLAGTEKFATYSKINVGEKRISISFDEAHRVEIDL